MTNPHGLGAGLPDLAAPGMRIRALSPADADDVFALFSDLTVVRYMSIPRMGTRPDAVSFINALAKDFEAGTLYQWGIEIDGRIAGTCTLAAISPQHMRAEVGFAVAPRLWGQGILSRALPAMVRFAFDRLGLLRLEAEVDPRNLASLNALARLGFQREGLQRERYRQYGEVQDAIVLGLLKDDWRRAT